MFRLVSDTHLPDVRSLYWENLEGCALVLILDMSVNRASTITSFVCWVIYFPIGLRHPFPRYWKPLLGITRATCSLPHLENQCQRSVNNFQLRILGNVCSDWLQISIDNILAACSGETTVTWSVPSPENERQCSVDRSSRCQFGNQGIGRILAFITELLNALIGQNTI